MNKNKKLEIRQTDIQTDVYPIPFPHILSYQSSGMQYAVCRPEKKKRPAQKYQNEISDNDWMTFTTLTDNPYNPC